jgi:hypothetical protein
MRDGALWCSPRSKQSHPAAALPLGAAADGIVLLKSEQIGIFSPETGEFSAFQPATKEDRDAIDGMRFQDRTYTGPGKLRVYATEGGVTIESNRQSRGIPQPAQITSLSPRSPTTAGAWPTSDPHQSRNRK